MSSNTCPTCRGEGGWHDERLHWYECGRCHGSGRVESDLCKICNNPKQGHNWTQSALYKHEFAPTERETTVEAEQISDDLGTDTVFDVTVHPSKSPPSYELSGGDESSITATEVEMRSIKLKDGTEAVYMSDEPNNLDTLIEWLQEKRAEGVREVSIMYHMDVDFKKGVSPQYGEFLIHLNYFSNTPTTQESQSEKATETHEHVYICQDCGEIGRGPV